MTIPKRWPYSQPSLRGGTVFVPTKQSPYLNAPTPQRHCDQERLLLRQSNLRYPRYIGKPKSEIASAHKTSLAMTIPRTRPSPPTSLRGGTVFVPTWQSPLPMLPLLQTVIATRDAFCSDAAISVAQSVWESQKARLLQG